MREKKKSFEEAINELEKIVETLEMGELPLEESIEIFQKGIELSQYCTRKLDEAEKKISMLIEDEKGGIREEAFGIAGPAEG